MAKTKFFRVAVEGATVDGRDITRAHIQQMSDSYRPDTYTARINCEHLRGYSPDGPFNAWGSIDAVKSEEVDLEIGGKTEKRLALFAQFDVNDQARSFNQAGQKLFSSIEIQPDFAKTGKAYLVGLAVTDSPASLGTEVLKFSRDDKRKDNLVQVEEFELAFEEEGGAADVAQGAFASMKRFFDSFGKAPETVITAPPAKVEETGDQPLAQFATQMGAQFETFGSEMRKMFTGLEAKIGKVTEDQNALAAKIENTPHSSFKARPLSSGGDGAMRAEC